MIAPKPENLQLLLEVYRLGLALGLVSREEIITWADDIIKTTYEPDYFFIELSLSHDINGLIEVLNKYVEQYKNPIYDRVILSLVYQRKPIYDVTQVENIAAFVGGLYSWGFLTNFENNTIFMFEDYYMYYSNDLTQLQVGLINFLAIYKEFTLENFRDWPGINEHVLELLKEEEIEVNIVNKSIRKARAKKEKKRKLKRTLIQICVIVLFLSFFVGLVMSSNNNTFPLPYCFFLVYFIARGGYAWWKKRKK